MYDTIRRQWAATTTSVKGKSQEIGFGTYSDEATVQEEASQGWACKKQKSAVRTSPMVKEYLTRVFNEGTLEDTQKQTQPTSRKTCKTKIRQTQMAGGTD